MNMLSWEWEPNANGRHTDFTRTVRTKTENMREYNRIYREKHSAYVDCGCGAQFKEISKYTHAKTARHLRWVDQKTSIRPSG
jgi:hypothetical protein